MDVDDAGGVRGEVTRAGIARGGRGAGGEARAGGGRDDAVDVAASGGSDRGGGAERLVDQLLGDQSIEVGECRAAAVGGGVSHLRASEGADGRDGRSLVGGAARGEEVGDSDGGNNADNRDDDQQLDEREAVRAALRRRALVLTLGRSALER